MGVNLRNRSFLKEIDFTPDELRFLLKLAAALKSAKNGGNERPSPGREEDRADLREDIDAHAHRVRGRRARPGGARHLPGAVRVADRPQGVDRGTPPACSAGCTTGSSTAATPRRTSRSWAGPPACRSRTGSPMSSTRRRCSADFLTMARAQQQTLLRHRLLLPRRLPQFNMGNSLMVMGCKLGMDVRLCAPERLWPTQDLVMTCQADRGRDRRAAHPDRRRRRGRARRGLPLHRRLGLDGRGPRASGRSGSSCSAPYQVNADVVRRTGNADGEASCTACRRSTTARRRSARRSSSTSGSTAWRSPTTSSSRSTRSSSTRPRTGCTRSRPSWSRRSGDLDDGRRDGGSDVTTPTRDPPAPPGARPGTGFRAHERRSP